MTLIAAPPLLLAEVRRLRKWKQTIEKSHSTLHARAPYASVDEATFKTLYDFTKACAYANKQIEKDQASAEPWQPEPGMKCAFWNSSYATQTTTGSYSEAPDGGFGPLEDVSNDYDHCAALDSIDEIGKPPQYFINRGRYC